MVWGAVSLAIAVQPKAMESKKTLEIQKGESFAMDGIELAKKYQDHFDTLNLKKVDEDYKLAAEHHKIDLDIYKGEKFEPRPFWKLPPREILGILAPALEECKIWEMVQYRYTNVGICGACVLPEVPYPEDMERVLNKRVFALIKGYLQSKGFIKLKFDTKLMELKYSSSLMYYRNKGEERNKIDKMMIKCIGHATPNVRFTPLIQYFEPYFIPVDYFWHPCDDK